MKQEKLNRYTGLYDDYDFAMDKRLEMEQEKQEQEKEMEFDD